MKIPRLFGIAALTAAMFILVAVFSTSCTWLDNLPIPVPTPTPTPTPEPPPVEPPAPPPLPTPQCTATAQQCGCYDGEAERVCTPPLVCTENGNCVDLTPPPPSTTACPKTLAEGATLFMRDTAHGQGFDSTLYVKGDPEFCQLIHGVSVNQCHLEGWSARVACEMELLGGCPVWEYSPNGVGSIIPCVDDHYALASCDHFGSVEARDDPQTPTTGDTLATLSGFEGRPLECGLQRDQFGPKAGFFIIAHGKGFVRACTTAGDGCGQWRAVDH